MVIAILAIASLVSVPSILQNDSTVFAYLRPTLKDVGGAARLYYAAECRPEENDPSGHLRLFFPSIQLQPPQPGATGLAAIRQVFQKDRNISIVQDHSGMVRITFGSVSTELLQTRLNAVALNSDQQYSPQAALLAIEAMPEVLAAEERLKLGVPWTITDIIVAGAIKGAPHLPGLMQDVTVDEALDSIARTFNGVVAYALCEQPNGKELFKLNFFKGSLTP